MNTCPNCGTAVQDGATFCPVCGTPITQNNANTYAVPNGRPGIVTPAERGIGMAILLTIVTCGFYGLYWFVKLNDETNQAAGKTEYTSGITAVLLTLVTCGIYGFIWYYKIAQVQDEALAAHGLPTKNNSVLYLVLGLFGLGIVNYCLIQSNLNDMSKVRR